MKNLKGRYYGINVDLYKKFKVEEKYKIFLEELENYLSKEKDSLANLANSSAFIYVFFENINWSGFYLLKEDELVLGPFCGMPATTRIKIGEGVCGYTAEKREVVVVDNVCEFPGHIACDVRSKSEIVLPIIQDDILCGVLDIDSGVVARFTPLEKETLEAGLEIMLKYIDFKKLV